MGLSASCVIREFYLIADGEPRGATSIMFS